jgi:hypothetical protein
MANQEYLDILKQGVEVWNKWREEHPDEVEIDLSGADLGKAKLSLVQPRRNNSGAYGRVGPL